MCQSLGKMTIPGFLFFRTAVLQRKPVCSSGEVRAGFFPCKVWSPARVENRMGSYEEDAEMGSWTGI